MRFTLRMISISISISADARSYSFLFQMKKLVFPFSSMA